MWFWFALAAAFFGAIEIVVNKKALHNVSPVVLTWVLITFSIPFFIIWVAIEQNYTFSPLFFAAAFASSLLYVTGKTIANSSIQKGLVSKLLPLSAFSGIFTYIFGLFFLGEQIAFFPLLGLIVVVIGSYILNAELAKEHILKPIKVLFTNKESLIYLSSLIIVSSTGVFDKTAIKQSSPAFTLLIENIIMFGILTPFLMVREKKWLKSVIEHKKILLFNGLIFAVMSIIVFIAIQDGPLALVTGVKRIQIFFILLLSILFLKEKVDKHVWVACTIMGLGVILIKLG